MGAEPGVRQQRIEIGSRFAAEGVQEIADVQPRLYLVRLGAGHDTVEHCCSMSPVVAAEKLVVLAFMQSFA